MAFFTKCMVLLCALMLVVSAGTNKDFMGQKHHTAQKNDNEHHKQNKQQHMDKKQDLIQHHDKNKHDNQHHDKNKHHDQSQKKNHAQQQHMEKNHMKKQDQHKKEVKNAMEMMQNDNMQDETMDMKKEPKCAEIVPTVAETFPFQAEILTATGLIDALSSFRGTIVLPTEEAFIAAVQALELDLEQEADVALVKEVILYHVIPDTAVYSGAATPLSIRVNTLLPEDSMLQRVCENRGLDFFSTLRFAMDFKNVQSGGVTANIETPDIELCGPTVVHTIDAVLLPCRLLR